MKYIKFLVFLFSMCCTSKAQETTKNFDIIPSELIVNHIIPELLYQTECFNEKMQALNYLSLINKRTNNILKNKNNKKNILVTLFRNSAISLILEKIKTPQESIDALFSIILGHRVFLPPVTPIDEGSMYKILIRFFKTQGADINSFFDEGREGRTLLYCGITHFMPSKFVETLLQEGANPNICNKEKTSPLMVAVWNGNIDLVDILIQYDADINAKNMYGNTIFTDSYHPRKVPQKTLDEIIQKHNKQGLPKKKASPIEKLLKLLPKCIKKSD